MKNVIKISAALPFLLLAAGCNDKDNPRPVGDYDVVMTVESGSTRAVGSLEGSDLENAFNPERLYFGTFSTDNGNLIHSLYEATVCNSELSVTYFNPNWGPSIAVKLPKETYQGKDFFIAAYSLPENVTFSTFSLRGLGNGPTNKLDWPGKAANKNVWAPSETEQIPMSGVMRITADYMAANYKENVFGHSPMQLPNIPLQRTMAKIIIEDADGIIASASLKTPEHGRLVPFLPALLDPTKQMEPAGPEGGTEFITQTLDAPNGENNGVKQYVFYSYEWSMLTYGDDGKSNGILPATHPDREIITLRANANSGLQGTARETTTINFAPHVDRIATGSGDALKTLDGGAWQGVMRNTVYTFRVYRPATGGVDVIVAAEPWTQRHQEEFDF